MASQRTKFSVGLFVAFGISLGVLIFIWLGMSRFLEKGQYYVTYFDESVQGLGVDSAVKYRGVSIGRVDDIGVAPDSRLIGVVLKVESGQELPGDIVAQLKPVGITGSVFVELDRKKEEEPDRSPVLTFSAEFPVVASKPSNISDLLKGFDDMVEQIRSLDLKGISDRIKMTMENVNQVIADADVKGISGKMQTSLNKIDRISGSDKWLGILASVEEAARSFNGIMAKAGVSLGKVETTLAHVEGIAAENKGTIKKAIEDFQGAMEKADALLESGTGVIDRTDDIILQLSRRLIVASQNLETASENLNRLIELVADDPSRLLFGEPPNPRDLESFVKEK